MTLKTKVGGEWKDISALKVKIGGEWKDVSTLYSKKDGAWVTVYSSGALITFKDYPYPIPVAAGWKYSTDKVNWTTVSSDGTINDSGTFTGWVKANSISLSNYYTRYIPEQIGVRIGTSSTGYAIYNSTSFVNGDHGFICGGYGGAYHDNVYLHDINGNITKTAIMSLRREFLDCDSSFANGDYGYVCGGYSSDGYVNNVDKFSNTGVKSTGTALSEKKSLITVFVLEGVTTPYGYVCGGINGNILKSVDRYSQSGVKNTANNLSVGRAGLTSFVLNSYGYVCGGTISGSTYSTVVDVYNKSGVCTTGTPLSSAGYLMTSFCNGSKGFVCGGSSRLDVVDIYDESGNRTTGTSLSVGASRLTSFVIGEYGFVCGGMTNTSTFPTRVDIYDSAGVRSSGDELSVGRAYLTSFVLGSKGFVCAGGTGTSTQYDTIDIYQNIPEEIFTTIPMTSGSTYTLNGTTSTATESQILSFDTKVSGTIKYKKGEVPEVPLIYSLIYDKSIASDPSKCLTYAGLCKGFTPMVGGSGNADEGSWAEGNGTLFDSIKVGYLNGSTFVEQSKSAVAGSTSYNCFTRIPKIYQKVTDISDAGDNTKVQLDLSLKPFDGATLHPAFIMDGVELTYKYIGRYLGYNNSSILESKSGQYPTGSLGRSSFRRYAYDNDKSSYGILSYYDWDLVNKLYLLAFKNWNSQNALGLGFVGSSTKTKTGGSDSKSWMYGDASDGTVQVSLFGIEDWWGNLLQLLDNYLTVSPYIYASNTVFPSDSDVSNMTKICDMPAGSLRFMLTCRAGLNDFFIGESEADDSGLTGMCDEQGWWSGTSAKATAVGGSYSGGNPDNGAFHFYSRYAPSYEYARYSARLVHWE